MERKAGKVSAAKAVGHFVLVEMLTSEEVMGTKLSLGSKTQPGVPQGYVLDIGPGVDLEKWNFKVGDRVLLQGSYIPVPKMGSGERELGMVECHAIKCVLQETRLCCGGGDFCSEN